MLTPAKINLGLEILNRRDDGYHNINSVFLPIPLYDELSFEPTRGDLLFHCDSLPEDDSNLCVRAARALRERFAVNDRGVSILLKKQIPVGAGLGGGSSDAACTLNALNALWSINAPREELRLIASRLGADVPFFLDPAPSIVRGIGDLLAPVRMPFAMHLLLVTPEISISTRWAYEQVSPQTPKKPSDYAVALGNMTSINDLRAVFANDFEACVFPHHPVLLTIKSALVELGASFASLSGSGSAMYGVFGSEGSAADASAYFHSRALRHHLLTIPS